MGDERGTEGVIMALSVLLPFAALDFLTFSLDALISVIAPSWIFFEALVETSSVERDRETERIDNVK